MHSNTLATTLAAAILALPLSSHALDWSDTSLAVKAGQNFTDPGVAQPIRKTIYEFVHISGDKVGKNLLVGQVFESADNDPAAGGGAGAQEFFGFYRRTFSLSRLSGKPVAFGPIKDVSAVLRFDRGTKNIAFAAAARKVLAGASVDWAVPAGYVETSLYSYREKNYNGIVGREVEFKNTFRTDTNWAIPVKLLVPGSWHGALSYTGKKGTDGFGNQTKGEVRLYTEYLVEVGHKSGFMVGIGFELWNNKYGADQRLVPGARQRTAMLVGEYHF